MTVLDEHCVECHRPEKREGDLDLSGDLTTFFNRSYSGRRNLMYMDHPDFRPVPTLESAGGIPPGESHE